MTWSLYGHDYPAKKPALDKAGKPIKAIMPDPPSKVVIKRNNKCTCLNDHFCTFLKLAFVYITTCIISGLSLRNFNLTNNKIEQGIDIIK
ncbi:hypothetical protein COD11_21840 [Bacillus sp. AFS040349]|nr:hypothetical protein COD11_21840 [Bacillus sp. AFS040349]